MNWSGYYVSKYHMMILFHFWVKLVVSGKTLMKALWRELCKCCNLYSILCLWLLMLKWWCFIEVDLILRLIGFVWCWIEISWLWIVRCCLRCKWYKDGDTLLICLVMMLMCKCANLTYMNCNERTILMKFYGAMMIINIHRIPLLTYIKLW